ncbi:MAG TPA: xanthine dehydrogenase family protein subunit M [Thermoanaerobaculia bacterium]|nr:xanthine dehydrogenase family protein subunit M [Thermoanaerobaculia bacterium]HRU10601.1 xanthine dehydrogenase family protein subunit M [Thermoanaerobaculia bacterium]
MLPPFTYVRPDDFAGAVRELGRPGARLHAGGTDLLGCLRDGVFTAERLVSLRRVTAGREIGALPDGGLRLGALVPVAAIAASPLVRERFPGLARAAADVASPQLRNQGTLGGNLCQRPRCWYFRGEFPCLKKGGDHCSALDGENRYHAIFGGGPCFIVHPSDLAPMLVALAATVRLLGPDGERRLPLAEFFQLPSENLAGENVLRPAEIVVEVEIPAHPGWQSSYRKVRERGSWDFALASVALALRREGERVAAARVVLGGVAPAPWRLPAVEAILTGRPLDAEAIREAAATAVAGAEPLAGNGYKVALVRGVIEESLLALR